MNKPAKASKPVTTRAEKLKAKQELDNVPVRSVVHRGWADDPPPPIDWPHWRIRTEVKAWEAVALSFGVNPEAYDPEREGWKFATHIVKRLRELFDYRKDPEFFSRAGPPKDSMYLWKCRLPEFAVWCVNVGYEIPPEFAAMVQTAGAGRNPVDHDAGSIAAEEGVDNDARLAALFDPVTVAVLEKMFPADGQWKRWAERAARNELAGARDGRRLFNPYRAAKWFLTKSEPNWDLARCNRVLANNLPSRSRDDAHLLTGDPI